MAEGAVDGFSFLRGQPRFGTTTAVADFLHPAGEDPDPSVSETYWFELLMPEHNLVGHVYLWTRPNLGICHSGVWIARGFIDHPLLMDHFDYRMALPMPTVEGSAVRVPSVGLSINVIEPLRVLDVDYVSSDNSTRLEFRATAVTPVVMRADEKHFEQFMKMEGELHLNGHLYKIDHFGSRDRSWQKARPEVPVSMPLMAWNSAVFDGGRLAFNLVGSDDPTDAEWARAYSVAPEESLLDGWYLRDGELLKVISMTKRTERDPQNRMRAIQIRAEFVDSAGDQHIAVGRPVAGSWLLAWPNLYTWLGLTEWQLDGVTGYGDTQEYCGPDFCRRFWR